MVALAYQRLMTSMLYEAVIPARAGLFITNAGREPLLAPRLPSSRYTV